MAWKLIPREKTFATILLRSVKAPFYCTRTAGLDEIFNVKLNSKADLISSSFLFGRIFSCKKALQTRGKKHFPKFWGSTHLVLVLDREELVVDTTSAFLHRAWAMRVAFEHGVPSLPYLLHCQRVFLRHELLDLRLGSKGRPPLRWALDLAHNSRVHSRWVWRTL